MGTQVDNLQTPLDLLKSAHLFNAFKNYAWDDISFMCDSLEGKVLQGRFSNSNTPLHEICSIGSAPHFLVEKVLLSWEEATTYKNRHGDTPLHITCRNSQRSCFVVSRLMKHSPGALTMKNEYGEIPLLVAFNSGSFLPVIKELVQANTATLLIRDEKGRVPAHTLWTSFSITIPGAMALRRNVSADSNNADYCMGGLLYRFWKKFKYVLLETNRLEYEADGRTFNENEICHMIITQNFKDAHVPLSLALRDNPDLGLQADSDGNHPLHVKAREGDAKSISLLLQKCVASASMRNDEGRIPLHFAVESKASWKNTLYPLVQAVPDSLGWKDPTTHLYPFMLAASVDDVGNTFQLLRAAPYVLNHN